MTIDIQRYNLRKSTNIHQLMHIRQVYKITKICITHLPPSTNNQKLQCQNKIRLNFKVKLNRHKKTLQRYIIAARSVTSTQNGIVKININALGIQNEDLKEYTPKHHVQCNHTCTSITSPYLKITVYTHTFRSTKLSSGTPTPAEQVYQKKTQLNTNRNGALIQSDNSSRSELTSSN